MANNTGGSDKKIVFKLTLDSKEFVNSLNNIVKITKISINKTSESVNRTAKKTSNNVNRAVKNTAENIKRSVEQVKNFANKQAEEVAKKSSTTSNVISRVISQACTKIGVAVSVVRQKISTAIDIIKPKVVAATTTAIGVVKQALTKMGNFVQRIPILGRLTKAIPKLVNTSAKLLNKASGKIKNIVTKTINPIAAKVNAGIKKVSQATLQACEKIGATISGLQQKISGVSSKIYGGVRQTLNKIGNMVRYAVYALITFIILNIGKAIEEASNLTEVQNVVDVAFGDMSKQVDLFAKNAIKSFGLSELSAKKYAGQLKGIANAMGIAQDAGTEMSLTLTGLSGDLASFWNTDADTAFTALKSVFTGETETLKKYGIALTETNLQEFAVTQGINKKISAMTQQEKVMLRYNYILSVTTDQQGDFVRTGDSFSNQLKMLKENWKQLLSVLGQGLVQVLTPLLQTLNNIVLSLTAMANRISNAISQIFGIKKQADTSGGSALSATYEEIGNAADNAAENIDGVIDKQKELNGLAGFDKINTIGSDDEGSGSSSGAGGGASFGINDSPYNFDLSEQVLDETDESETVLGRFFQWFKDRFDNTKDTISRVFEGVDYSHLKEAWGGFSDEAGISIDWLIEKAAIFARWFSENVLPILLEIAQVALPLIRQIIDSIDWEAVGDMVVKALEWILEKLTAIKEWAEQNPDKFAKIVDFAAKALAIAIILGPIILGILSTVVSIISFIATAASMISTISSVVSAVGGAISACIPYVAAILAVILAIVVAIKYVPQIIEDWGQIFQEFGTMMKTLGKWIKVHFLRLMEDIGTKLKGFLTNAKNWVSDKINGIVDKFNSFKDTIKGFFTNIGDHAKSIFNGVVDSIKGAFNIVISAVNSMISGINKVKIDVPDWVPGIGGGSYGFNIPQIPMLANGGVISQPTVAMMGEYAGARNNPEIVAPEAKLTAIFTECMDEFTNRIVAAMQANSNNGPEAIYLQAKGKDLMSWIRDENQRESYRRGASAI